MKGKKNSVRRLVCILLAVVLLGSIGTIAAVQSGDNSVSTLSKWARAGMRFAAYSKSSNLWAITPAV